ncbi:MAG: tRNA pseudouridine(13) synthase TruD, partial [Phycisphaerae bacterium]|nr:tRNA pseudouridine(13) synthase TruD [Phycisphaerae bacterium]
MTLRRNPLDFQVDERLTAACLDSLATQWSEESPYAVFRLTKTGLSTPEAVTHLCRALRITAHASSYAGLKDRHAVTSQHVSVHAPVESVGRAMQKVHETPDWKARLVGWSSDHLSAAAIGTNEFALVVRGLTEASCAAMDTAAQALQAPAASAGGAMQESSLREDGGRSLLLANYFGDQRFGSARHGQGFAAEALLKGDFINAIRLLVGTPARKDRGDTRIFTRLCAQHWGDWSFLAAGLPRCPERAPFERLATGHEPIDAFAAIPRFLQSLCIEAFQSLLWNDTLRSMALELGGSA